MAGLIIGKNLSFISLPFSAVIDVFLVKYLKGSEPTSIKKSYSSSSISMSTSDFNIFFFLTVDKAYLSNSKSNHLWKSVELGLVSTNAILAI